MMQPSHSPGRLSRALLRMLMKQARVVESEAVGEGFRLITLESPEFRALQWAPGQKLQIAMGSAFVARTFTPIEWDAAAGRTRIVGYAHGDGPGSAWLRDIRPGDECDVFGPRASLDLSHVPKMTVMFGDETSIGLAYALSRHAPDHPLHCLLEVNVLADTLAVLKRLSLERVELFERMENGAQLAAIERRLPALATHAASFVLTGMAPSIQHLRQSLKTLGVPAARIKTKAYWAPGKSGLD